MRKFLAIPQKDFKSYFTSPIAYVVLTVFLVVSGFLFFNLLSSFNYRLIQLLQLKMQIPTIEISINLNDWILNPLFNNLGITLLLMLPILTMRLFAEEKKTGTFELVMTSPVSILQVVMGKFIACLIFFIIMLFLTIQYPLILYIYGNPDLGPVYTSYLGLLLLGCTFIAIGIFTSALTENQIISAIISFGILLILWIISWLGDNVGGKWGEVISYLSLLEHFDDFSKGVINTKDIVFYLSSTFLGLCLTFQVIKSQQWK